MINILNAEVSIVGIVLAVVANIVVGMVWYHPKVMGTKWAASIGKVLGEMKMESTDMLYATLASLATAFVLTLLLAYAAANSVLAEAFGGEAESGILMGAWTKIGTAVAVSLLVWIGFFVPAHMNRYIWEGKNYKLFVINSLHALVTVLVMSFILVFFIGENGFM